MIYSTDLEIYTLIHKKPKHVTTWLKFTNHSRETCLRPQIDLSNSHHMFFTIHFETLRLRYVGLFKECPFRNTVFTSIWCNLIEVRNKIHNGSELILAWDRWKSFMKINSFLLVEPLATNLASKRWTLPLNSHLFCIPIYDLKII